MVSRQEPPLLVMCHAARRGPSFVYCLRNQKAASTSARFSAGTVLSWHGWASLATTGRHAGYTTHAGARPTGVIRPSSFDFDTAYCAARCRLAFCSYQCPLCVQWDRWSCVDGGWVHSRWVGVLLWRLWRSRRSMAGYMGAMWLVRLPREEATLDQE